MKRALALSGVLVVLAAVAYAIVRSQQDDADAATGLFEDPEGLAVDALGNIYVADEDLKQFTVLDREGQVLARFKGIEGYTYEGVPAPFSAGDSFVVLAPMHVVAIARFDLAELKIADGIPSLVRIIGTRKGTGPGAFGDPEGIARNAANGDLYVTDEDNRRIQVFDRDGQYLREWPVPDDPEAIGLVGDRLYVTFSKDDWIGCYTKEGELQFRFGKEGNDPGEFDNPDFVCESPDGRLYVTDQKNHRIQVFELDGKHCFTIGKQGSAPGEFQSPEDLAFDPEGNLVVADAANHRIQILTPDGRPLRVID